VDAKCSIARGSNVRFALIIVGARERKNGLVEVKGYARWTCVEWSCKIVFLGFRVKTIVMVDGRQEASVQWNKEVESRP
jgi:hypothetical protein